MSSPRRRQTLQLLVRVAGLVAAVAAVAFLVVTLWDAWPEVSEAITDASRSLIGLAWLASLGAMAGLAVLWWSCLRAFDTNRHLMHVSGWYFAGELGKYVPGGIWPVVGRGELASRFGVRRPVAYGTTMLSLAVMVLGGIVLAALLLPFALGDSDTYPWMWALVAAVPLGAIALHPAILGPVLRAISRATRGRVDIEPAPWGTMLVLAASSIPTWILVGVGSWLVGRALGYQPDLPRTVFAATLAWVVGFVAVPVPAGAGIREVVFVATSGLGTTEATVVATVSRFLFVVVDAVCGLAALGYLRVRRPLPEQTS
ncbi:MAG: lysylphosphatidylglycerol synthase domain-containing protein [Microthrixaceae bacterium]